jgi:hypothetical protein
MNKHTLVILVVAAALLGLLLLFENPFKGEEEQAKPRKEELVQLVVPPKEEDISRIQVSNIMTSVTLVNKGGEWFTSDGFPADVMAVRRLFQGLQEVKEPELVSINPKTFIQFRVDPVTGTRVRMVNIQGQPAVDLIIGEMQGDFMHSAVRKPDSDNVYRVRSQLRMAVGMRDWRNMSILFSNPESVQRVSVASPETSYTLVRGEGEAPWRFADSTSASLIQPQVDNVVRAASMLRASGIEPTTATDSLTSYGLAHPTASLSVALKEGTSYTVYFGASRPALNRLEYFAKRADQKWVYRVTEADRNVALRKKEDLLQKPPAAPKPMTLPPGTTSTLPFGLTSGPLFMPPTRPTTGPLFMPPVKPTTGAAPSPVPFISVPPTSPSAPIEAPKPAPPKPTEKAAEPTSPSKPVKAPEAPTTATKAAESEKPAPPEAKPESKPEPKPEAKSEPTTESKAQPKPEVKPEPKREPSPGSTTTGSVSSAANEPTTPSTPVAPKPEPVKPTTGSVPVAPAAPPTTSTQPTTAPAGSPDQPTTGSATK